MAGIVTVGYDGSDASRVALDWALRHAERAALDVDVVFVADTSWDSASFTATTALKDQGELVLSSDSFHALSKAPHVAVTSRVLTGRPVDVLAEAAKDSALLVVGTYRKDAYERLTTSAVSVKVVAGATVPVVVVPETSTGSRSGVVVGVDGAEPSARLVEAAAVEAERLGEPLRIVSAWTLPPMSVPEYSDTTDLYDALEARAREIVDDAVAAAKAAHPDLEISGDVELDSPVAALTRAAQHARHGLSRFLLGSVTHDVVLHATSPLLVLRSAALQQ
jgi:nucleotide-binding universal stress UspA family protein